MVLECLFHDVGYFFEWKRLGSAFAETACFYMTVLFDHFLQKLLRDTVPAKVLVVAFFMAQFSRQGGSTFGSHVVNTIRYAAQCP